MTTPAKAIVLSEYIRTPEILARFADLLGNRESQAYVQSVLIAVSGSDELMKCTPQSIVRSALRAASLGLSCDPALKQAWLVPYNKKKGDSWIKEAQFQPHYRGLYTLAMRTGKYSEIEVIPIGSGYRVENSIEGGIVIVHEGTEKPALALPKCDPTKARIWFAWFKTTRGFIKKVWMTVEEIDAHAQKYVKDYAKNPNWNDPDKRAVMEMKTVLRELLSWADKSGTENAQLTEALRADDPDIVDAEEQDKPEIVTKIITAVMNIEQARSVIGETEKGERFIGELSVDQLNKICLSEGTSETQKQAAVMVLKTDFNLDPPVAAPRSKEQNLRELGY